MSVSFHFKGKVALITGSSSGIGAGIALLFAKSGADVVITGRNAENLSKVAEKCLKESNGYSTVLQVVADISKEENMERVVKSTIDKFGKLDVLVNNAGIASSADISDPNFMNNYRIVLKTNVDSTVYMTHLCVEYLAQTQGNIINISSIMGKTSFPKFSSYCMSKISMDMFTRCMAVELGEKRIRVNSLNVGIVETAIFDKMNLPNGRSETMFDKYGDLYPVGRVGQPQDIANIILFLASENAAFITGSNILIDGGHIAANLDLSHVPNH